MSLPETLQEMTCQSHMQRASVFTQSFFGVFYTMEIPFIYSFKKLVSENKLQRISPVGVSTS